MTESELQSQIDKLYAEVAMMEAATALYLVNVARWERLAKAMAEGTK
jgi:hypothetical protein